jgi:hypothetical protein
MRIKRGCRMKGACVGKKGAPDPDGDGVIGPMKGREETGGKA